MGTYSDYSVGMISLGCPKNQVDAEIMLSKLAEKGYTIAGDVYDADAVIINTCGFITDAKQEAIDNILEMAELKNAGEIRAIVVTGCLAERYREEVMKEIPEIDAILGIGDNENIAEAVLKAIEGERYISFPDKYLLPMDGARMLTTPEFWAYLKIAEGCSNRCTYCAIPNIRGNFRSREEEKIIEEARQLAESGVKEIVVVAQDTTKYGIDLYGEYRLPKLLRKISELDGIKRIRILYCYPDAITSELLEEMRDNDKICNYIDLPLQHSSETVLKRMNRKGSTREYLELIEKIRSYMPDVIIRTTLITGFPGETQEEFEELCEFVKKAKFDRLGCFAFSPEEGTPAYDMPGQIDEQTKADRGDIIMREQYDIFTRKLDEKIGKVYSVMVEGYDDYTDTYFGRSYMDTAEIDSLFYFTSSCLLEDGVFVRVKALGYKEYDLLGECIDLD